ncbi:MAG TPA: CCA tRNA nucleotidyltransferase, partial [Acidimicrobiales bacterium]|nr:CCA tRNA nucleotidyltransferase [Acidimicrobiales bacterium]
MVPERLQPLLEEAAPLAQRFAAAGWRLYLVGGSVRDAILGVPPKDKDDLDFTTDARPEDIEAVVKGWADAVWDQGRRFGTIGVKKGSAIYEITTHRADAYTADSRKPDVQFSDAVEADLSRRDFTVNAMAL